MLDCYLRPYFGHRQIESITRLDIEKSRADMAAGTPEPVKRARDAKRAALQVDDPKARLKPLKAGPRTTNRPSERWSTFSVSPPIAT